VTHPSTPFQSFGSRCGGGEGAAPHAELRDRPASGSGAHIATVLLQQRGGFELEHVPVPRRRARRCRMRWRATCRCSCRTSSSS
jgi:hypothetical protein